MPYTLDKPPATISTLPDGAKRIWITTFNAVHGQNQDENAARMAAWSNVKAKYKKDGDKWVKKEGA